MCRLAAYRGPAIPLASLLYDAEHGLERQAYRPREMVSGTVSVDGTGVAWWPEGETEPLRYVTERPPWSDANLPALSRRLRGRMQIAAVRSATPGMPFGPGTVLPFVHAGVAGALNGYIGGFREGTGAEMIARLPRSLQGSLDTFSDAALVFLAALAHREANPGADLAAAAVAGVSQAVELCGTAGAEASLTLVLADGDAVAAVRTAVGVPPNSLYVLEGSDRWPGGRLIASEALDGEAGWTEVPPDHVITLGADGTSTRPLTA